MQTDILVQTYRFEPDPGDVKRNTLIERHIIMTQKIAARFIGPRHDYDDIMEYAQYQLVEAVVKAKDALMDNNIRPYLIKVIRLRLLDYVTFDHIITVPSSCGPQAWSDLGLAKPDNPPTWHDGPVNTEYNDTLVDRHRNACLKRSKLKDRVSSGFDIDEGVLLRDTLDRCITSDAQRKVVEWRLADLSFVEIGKRIGLTTNACQEFWYEYCDAVQEVYV